MKRALIIIGIIMISIDSSAQSWQDTLIKIESIFSRYKPEAPGCQLSISRNGKMIFSKAWGKADLERKISLDTKSIFVAASVSKQFTAAAILLLEQQGKLSLKDEVRQYIPDLPDYGKPITVNQMLHHTSGLRDWGEISDLAGWPYSSEIYTNEFVKEIIIRQKKLNNTPGEEYTYSNSNYILCALIVERLSGMSMQDFCSEFIFKPAGMANTSWPDDKIPGRNLAISYKKNIDRYEVDNPKFHAYGPGGLLTTSEDLLKWNDFYLSGKLGSPSLLSKQIDTDTLNNGSINKYGAGLYIGENKGWSYISHGGATAGYRAQLEAFPELNLSIAWLSNTSEFDTSGINVVKEVRNLFVKKRGDPKAVKHTRFQMSDEQMKDFVGIYKSAQSGVDVKITHENHTLRAFGTELIPVGNNIFMFGEVAFSFASNKNLRVMPPVTDPVRYYRTDSIAPSGDKMKEYQGQYYSKEANAAFEVIVKENMVHLKQSDKVSYLASPICQEVFFIKELNGDVCFNIDQNNNVRNMMISTGRANNMNFIKMP